MKKNFLQDVVPPAQKRSIREVPLPRSRNANPEPTTTSPVANFTREPAYKEPMVVGTQNMAERPVTENRTHQEQKFTPRKDLDSFERLDNRRGGGIIKKLFWVVIAILIVSLLVFVTRTNSKIKVEIKKESVFISDSFQVYDKAQLDAPNDSLEYRKLPVEKTVSTNVPATGEEEVSEKASGTIKIINFHSDKPQKLVATTRFEAPNGKIYRIANSVEVPGMNGGSPGEIEVEVFADEEGESYNQGKVDFTIPGFKGLPQFEDITATSVTDMSGGFVGIKKTVSEKNREEALELLKESAKDQIRNEIISTNDQFVVSFIEDEISYSSVNEKRSEAGVEMSLKAQLEAFVFDRAELSNFLASKALTDVANQRLNIQNINDIRYEVVSVNLNTEEEAVDPKTHYKINIEGDLQFEWLINFERLKEDLEGRNRTDLKDILSAYRGINKAEASISPFWKNKFPKANKIEIIVEN